MTINIEKNLDTSESFEKPDHEYIFEKPTITAPRKYELDYKGVFTVIYFHLASLYGIYLLVTSAKMGTILLNVLVYFTATLGATAGSHRLWAHKSYKATKPLQILLMLCQSTGFQFSVITWVKSHRIHHKYTDTDADPYNATRGFFFSHVGWMMVKAHEEFINRLKVIDVSDLTSNPILAFQKKYAYPLIGMLCFGLPTLIPMIFWGETLNNAWHIAALRYTLCLNVTFFINSVAHRFGYRPYNDQILPTQNHLASFFLHGEGFHNYHHTFPCDYRAAELGNYSLNLTAKFIDLLAYFGLAYDLKTTNVEIIKARAKKTGDGTDCWGNKKDE